MFKPGPRIRARLRRGVRSSLSGDIRRFAIFDGVGDFVADFERRVIIAEVGDDSPVVSLDHSAAHCPLDDSAGFLLRHSSFGHLFLLRERQTVA